MLLGSAHNVGFDIDDSATRVARDNFAQLDAHVDIVHADVRAMRYAQADDEQDEAEAVGNSGGRPSRGKAGRGRGSRLAQTARGGSRSAADKRRIAQRTTARNVQSEEDEESEEDRSDVDRRKASAQPDSLSSPPVPYASLRVPPPCLLDTVVLNPPFGTRQSGVDVTFLHVALQLARTAVYSLHKSSTRPFFVRLCERWGVAGEVIAEMRFDLKRSYAFHREAVREVEVDLWRFTFVDGRKPQRFCAPGRDR